MAFPLYIALLSTSIIAINYIFPLLLLPILFAFFTNWLIYQYVLCKRHIEINHQGICWHGFGLNKLPKFCAWEELDQVSLSKIGMFGIRQATLVFSRKDGSDFLFSIENNFWNFIYYFYAGRLVNVFLCMAGTDNLYIHDWDCLLLSRYGNLVSIGKRDCCGCADGSCCIECFSWRCDVSTFSNI